MATEAGSCGFLGSSRIHVRRMLSCKNLSTADQNADRKEHLAIWVVNVVTATVSVQ